jgi:hypothetical protein
MPYTSRSQQRAFHAKLSRGEIKASTVKEFDKASKGLKLPERAHKKKTTARRKRKKRAAVGFN